MSFNIAEFEELATVHRAKLCRIAAKYLNYQRGYRRDVEDVVQTGLGEVWIRRDQVTENLSLYLKVVIKKIAMRWREDAVKGPWPDKRTGCSGFVNIKSISYVPEKQLCCYMDFDSEATAKDLEILVSRLTPSQQATYYAWQERGFNSSGANHAEQCRVTKLKKALIEAAKG